MAAAVSMSGYRPTASAVAICPPAPRTAPSGPTVTEVVQALTGVPSSTGSTLTCQAWGIASARTSASRTSVPAAARRSSAIRRASASSGRSSTGTAGSGMGRGTGSGRTGSMHSGSGG